MLLFITTLPALSTTPMAVLVPPMSIPMASLFMVICLRLLVICPQHGGRLMTRWELNRVGESKGNYKTFAFVLSHHRTYRSVFGGSLIYVIDTTDNNWRERYTQHD